MTAAFQRNLYLNQGADYTLVLALEDSQGRPVEGITDCLFYARPNYASSRILAMKAIFEDSSVHIIANASETKRFIPGKYNYTLEYSDMTGNRMRLLEGVLTVRESMVPYGGL